MDPNNNNDDNLFSQESIFDSAKNIEKQSAFQKDAQVQKQTNCVLGKFIRSITNKLNEYDEARANKKIQDEMRAIFEQQEDVIKLLMQCGCKLQYINNTLIKITWERFNLQGLINLAPAEGEEALDEGAQKIVRQMFSVIRSSDNMEDSIDRLESEGFYPVGELEKQDAIIEGKKCTVLVGTFQNDAGETRKIYFYNGTEVFLSDQSQQPDQQTPPDKPEK